MAPPTPLTPTSHTGELSWGRQLAPHPPVAGSGVSVCLVVAPATPEGCVTLVGRASSGWWCLWWSLLRVDRPGSCLGWCFRERLASRTKRHTFPHETRILSRGLAAWPLGYRRPGCWALARGHLPRAGSETLGPLCLAVGVGRARPHLRPPGPTANTSPRPVSGVERERKVSMRLHRGAPVNMSSSDLTGRQDTSRMSTSQVRVAHPRAV